MPADSKVRHLRLAAKVEGHRGQTVNGGAVYGVPVNIRL